MRSKIEQLAIANPVDALCQYLMVSICGVYAISLKMESYHYLFHQAVMALYHAKEHGRDRYVVRNFV